MTDKTNPKLPEPTMPETLTIYRVNTPYSGAMLLFDEPPSEHDFAFYARTPSAPVTLDKIELEERNLIIEAAQIIDYWNARGHSTLPAHDWLIKASAYLAASRRQT